jgi:hypothetical protein
VHRQMKERVQPSSKCTLSRKPRTKSNRGRNRRNDCAAITKNRATSRDSDPDIHLHKSLRLCSTNYITAQKQAQVPSGAEHTPRAISNLPPRMKGTTVGNATEKSSPSRTTYMADILFKISRIGRLGSEQSTKRPADRPRQSSEHDVACSIVTSGKPRPSA